MKDGTGIYLAIILYLVVPINATAELPYRFGLVGHNHSAKVRDNRLTGLHSEQLNCILTELGNYKLLSLPSSGRATEELRKGGIDIGLFLSQTDERDRHAEFYDFGWKQGSIRLYSKLPNNKKRISDKEIMGVRAKSPLEFIARQMDFGQILPIPKAEQLLGMLVLDRINYYLEAEKIFSIEAKKANIKPEDFQSIEVKKT